MPPWGHGQAMGMPGAVSIWPPCQQMELIHPRAQVAIGPCKKTVGEGRPKVAWRDSSPKS